MLFNNGCTHLGQAISSLVELAVDINFIHDTTKVVNCAGRLSAVGRPKSYSALLRALRSMVCEEDAESFDAGFCAENVVTRLCDGERVVEFEVRFRVGDGSNTMWCNAQFMRVYPEGEFDGLVVLILNNIDHHKAVEAKAAELSEWVDRDPLTGLYNVKAARTIIDAFLEGEGKNGRHTILFCDIDNFKSVNDSYGHQAGDMLLSGVADKLTQTFQRDDVVCRIGGDEFVVLMKNTTGRTLVSRRADIMLERIKQAFILNGHKVNVTVSVGIAGYPECGSKYAELLAAADKAMYASKFNGKNQYSFSDDAIAGGSAAALRANRVAGRGRETVSDYIFNSLYESGDLKKTVPLVMQLLGTHFNLDRVAIAEFDGDLMHVTRQWNAAGVKELEKPLEYTGEMRALFESSRSSELMALRYNNFEEAPADVREKMIRAGVDDVKAFIHCPLLDGGAIRGYIAFFDCTASREWSEEERSTLSYVARLLSVFVFKQQAHDRILNAYNMTRRIMESTPMMMHMVNPDNHELLFASESTMRQFPDAKLHEKCYCTFFGNDAPCEFCPMKSWREQGRSGISRSEFYSSNFGEWLMVGAAGIELENGQLACLCTLCSITQFKQRETELENENARLKEQLAKLTGGQLVTEE